MTEPRLKADHGLDPSSFPDAQGLSQEAIDNAIETIRRLAGWHVWPEREETVTVVSPGDPLVLLPTKHLVAVSAVTVDGGAVAVGEEDWTPDGTLWVESLRPSPYGRPRRVTATIRHGYSGPGDLLALVASMAGRASRPGESYTVGRINVGAPGAVTPQSTEWRIIDQIKLGPVP